MVCHSKTRLVLVDEKDRILEELFDIEEINESRKPQLIKKIIMHAFKKNWLDMNQLLDFFDKNHFWSEYDAIKTKSFTFRFQMWNFSRLGEHK
jgi:hypothetical protein